MKFLLVSGCFNSWFHFVDENKILAQGDNSSSNLQQPTSQLQYMCQDNEKTVKGYNVRLMLKHLCC